MGGADPEGDDVLCPGDDVLSELNGVFGYPNSDRYKYAKSHNKFGRIPNAPDNYKALIDAYEYAGVPVSKGWQAYLRLLGTIRTPDPQQGPQNIYDIAQARNNGLITSAGMSTIVHEPHSGGHVHTRPGAGAASIEIDSPFPLPSGKK